MKATTTTSVTSITLALLLSATTQHVQAQSVSQIFHRDPLIFIVPFAPGGGSDIYARLLGQYFSRQHNVPVIVKNMPGASGQKAASHLFGTVKPDGKTVSLLYGTLPVYQRIGILKARFDARRFAYLVRLDALRSVLIVQSNSAIKSYSDAKRRYLSISAMSKTSVGYVYPRVLNAVEGTKFRLITGYKGSVAQRLASDRGETDGYFASWPTVRHRLMGRIKSGGLRPLLQIGPNKIGGLPGNVPLLSDLGRNSVDRQVLQLLTKISEIGLTVIAPPGVRQSYVNTLQIAFFSIIRMNQFRAAVEKNNLTNEPLSGPDVQNLVRKLFATSSTVAQQLHKILY